MRLRVIVLACVLAGLAGVAVAAPGKTTVVRDDTGDQAQNAIDIVRVSLGRASDGRLRAAITAADGWDAGDLRSTASPQGSVCVKLWTTSKPPDAGPDYLVCITPAREEGELQASVLRERANQLPERVGPATLSRGNERTAVLRWGQSRIGRPTSVRFAAEATKAGCIRVSCVDTAPDAPDTARYRVR